MWGLGFHKGFTNVLSLGLNKVHCPYAHSGHEMEMAKLDLLGELEVNGDKDGCKTTASLKTLTCLK